MRVELHNPQGKIAEVTLVGSRAQPDERAGRFLDGYKVVEPRTFEVLGLEEGERYLRALPYNVAGQRLWAVLVEA